MNDKTIETIETIEAIIEQGIKEQKKTIESIFGFAKCMVDLKNACKTVRGGTEFSKIASERWNISQSACIQWLAIGLDNKLITRSKEFKLPNSWRSMYELTTLSEEDFNNFKTD